VRVKIEALADADAVARAAAAFIAGEARAAVAARGRFTVAVSGGRTPWVMLRALAGMADVPWQNVHLFQVDERIAPPGDADRNLTHLAESLLNRAPLCPEQIHAMPVEFPDVAVAAVRYGATLREVAGSPPVLDLVHLGLGPDGHTASLVPGDPVLEVKDRDIALSAPYQGALRMTLTFPALSRARERLWLVTGASKAAPLQELLAGTGNIPAIHVSRDHATVIADAAAAPGLAGN
jgi:6-phosphogluconolactonase